MSLAVLVMLAVVVAFVVLDALARRAPPRPLDQREVSTQKLTIDLRRR